MVEDNTRIRSLRSATKKPDQGRGGHGQEARIDSPAVDSDLDLLVDD
jgi:hypothetical protein